MYCRALAATRTRNYSPNGFEPRRVAAFRSQSALDLIQDPSLWNRELFRCVSDHEEGARPIVGVPWRMSRAQATVTRGAPLLGEHNAYVYCDILGFSPEKLQELIQVGAVD